MPTDEQNTQSGSSSSQGQGSGNLGQQSTGTGQSTESRPVNTDRGGNPNAATENRGMFSEHIEKKEGK